MLSDAPSLLRVSTGFDALDAVLGGLFWGENVVWQFDGTPVEPFYRAIAGHSEAFETMTIVTLGRAVTRYGIPGVTIVDAAPGGAVVPPGELLREIRRLCRPRGRRLLLFEPLDTMVQAWGVNGTREFFGRCCPLLLDVGALAYWSMNVRATPPALQDAVEAVTQCVLRVDERNVRVVKAEAREETVRGSVLHRHDESGLPVLSPPELVGRVAASLRAVRRARTLSQHDLGDLAGVTASAISQAERGERGLSLATLVRLSDALGVTIDDLVRGEERADYRIGRRGLQQALTLLDGPDSDVRVDLVHLDPREAAEPAPGRPGTGIVAVAGGLVQVLVAAKTPALRHGEVLVADSERITGWRNLGQAEALLFWIVAGPTTQPGRASFGA
jgi:transcriptional regulator with XRE-family HTH domain